MELDLFYAVLRGDRAGVEEAVAAEANVNARIRAPWQVATQIRERLQRSGRETPDRRQAHLRLLEEAWAGSARFPDDPRVRTPLLLAAQYGETEVAAALLERKADPNSADEEGWTPLFLAIRRADVPLARLLLEAGAKPDTPLQGGMTPLFLATRIGQAELVSRLLEAGADPNLATDEGLTPLMAAAAFGHILLNYAPDDPLDEETAQNYKPQYIATQEMLLLKGADPNAVAEGSGFNDRGTPLKYAALAGCFTTLQMILNAGAEVNFNSGSLPTALMAAACTGKRLTTSLLLERGAEINAAGNDGLTALMCAARYGHTDLAQWLIELGARISASRTNGETALAIAATQNQTDTARMLIYQGAEVDTADAQGRTPLMRAAFAGHLETVQLLLDLGADVSLRSLDGRSALGWAQAETLLEQLSGRMEAFFADPIGVLHELGYDLEDDPTDLEARLQEVFAAVYTEVPTRQQTRRREEEQRRSEVVRLLTAAGATP